MTTTSKKKREKYHNSKNPWKLKLKPSKLSKACENTGGQAMIGSSFASFCNWLRVWYKFLRPITEQSKAKNNPILDYKIKTLTALHSNTCS